MARHAPGMAAQSGGLRTTRSAPSGVVSPVKRPDDVRCSPPGDPRRGRAPFGALQRRSSVTMKWIRWGSAPHCPSHARGARRP